MVARTVEAPAFDRARWHRECEQRLAIRQAVKEATSSLYVQGGELEGGYVQESDPTGGVLAWAVPMHDVLTQDGTRPRYTLPHMVEDDQVRYQVDPVEWRQAGNGRRAYLSEHTVGEHVAGPYDDILPEQYRRARVYWRYVTLRTTSTGERRAEAGKRTASKRKTTPGATAADRKALRDRRDRERRALEAGVSLAELEAERLAFVEKREGLQADSERALEFLALASDSWDRDSKG